MAEFDPRRIFDVLDRHDVRYVLIGGLAAILHGASHLTTDVDVVPKEARENLWIVSPQPSRTCTRASA